MLDTDQLRCMLPQDILDRHCVCVCVLVCVRLNFYLPQRMPHTLCSLPPGKQVNNRLLFFQRSIPTEDKVIWHYTRLILCYFRGTASRIECAMPWYYSMWRSWLSTVSVPLSITVWSQCAMRILTECSDPKSRFPSPVLHQRQMLQST